MAKIISRNGSEIVLQVTVKLNGSMLEMEENIQEAANRLGMCATQEALSRFDTNGSDIRIGDMKLYGKGKVKKIYETPYGAVELDRNVYQGVNGGKTYCPLDERARSLILPIKNIVWLIKNIVP